jgi:hypothetical protein
MLTGENSAVFASRVKEIGKQTQASNGDISTFHETTGTAGIQLNRAQAAVKNMGIELGTALLPALKSALEFFQKIVKWLQQNWSWVSKVALAVLGLALAFKVINGVLAAVRTAMMLFNAVMALNPIGLVVIAVAALVAGIVLLWNKCAWFRDLIKGAVGHEAAAYLVPRAGRSVAELEKLVAAIDRLSLERKVPATQSIWRAALEAVHGPEEPRLL